MQSKCLLFLLFLPFAAIAFAPKPKKPAESIDYLKVKVEKGQGAYALLRQYDLLNQDIHLSDFYNINKLKPNTELIAGKKYLLPVAIKKFDGKSIRSSIGISDYEIAKDIEAYNEKLLQKNIKKTSFKKSNELWVPSFYLSNTGSVESVVEEKKGIQQKKTSIKDNNSQLVADVKLDENEIALLKSRYEQKIANAGHITAETEEDAPTATLRNTDLISTKAMTRSSLAYTKLAATKILTADLFGPNYKNVPITANYLKNEIFYIVPGHGGPDPGAMATNVDGNNTLCEDEYAYDVCLRLARNLMIAGATVYLIVQDKNDGIRDELYLDCDYDEVCIGDHEIPLSQKKRLRQGMQKVNKLFDKHNKQPNTKQWMISIHVDSRPSNERQDVFFYYQAGSSISQEQAEKMQTTFAKKYESFQGREYNGSCTSRPLYVMRASDAEPIYIELANIKNEEDRKRILYPKNRQLVADWITESFLPASGKEETNDEEATMIDP